MFLIKKSKYVTGFSGELDDETMEAYEKRVVFRELEDYVIAVVIK